MLSVDPLLHIWGLGLVNMIGIDGLKKHVIVYAPLLETSGL